MRIPQKQKINLLVTIDKNYIEPLKTMLCFFGRQHNDCLTDLYVVHSALSEKDFEEVANAVADYPKHIQNIKIVERYLKDMPVLAHIPEESFYRLLAFQYLPENIDRCLYLDPDILIQKSLLPLYSMDFNDKKADQISLLYYPTTPTADDFYNRYFMLRRYLPVFLLLFR